MFKTFFPRAWRRFNRIISRVWLRTQVRQTQHCFDRYGEGHAAWWALSHSEPNGVAYCGGVGMDATFDFELSDKLGLEVHSFDPTPSSIDYMGKMNKGRVTFHPWGILDRDALVRFYAPVNAEHANWFVDNLHGSERYFDAECYAIRTIMGKLGHTEIDLLKLDIEGSWGAAIDTMLRDGIYPQVVCVEFDSPAPLLKVKKTVRALQSAGYKLVRREKENCAFVRSIV